MNICLGWSRFNATLVGHSARTTQVVTCSSPDPRLCWSRSQFAAIVVLCCGCDVVNAVDVDADNRPLISVWCCGEMLHCCNHKWLAQHLPSTEHSVHQNMRYLNISINIYILHTPHPTFTVFIDLLHQQYCPCLTFECDHEHFDFDVLIKYLQNQWK